MDHLRRSLLNCFTDTSLDRITPRRLEPGWVAGRLSAPGTRLLPLLGSNNLFSNDETPVPIALEPREFGPQPFDPGSVVLLGELNGLTYFSLDLGHSNDDLGRRLGERGRFLDLYDVGAALEAEIASVLAYARGITYWHRRHRFCGECGRPSRSAEAGHMRICTEASCGAKEFPRTDAAVIVLVYHGGRCLLARQRGWRARLFSVVAGFVEPGESIEETVLREVREETGIAVTDVHYRSSQPWPFPSSLMLGFEARALGTDIVPGDDELAEAAWYSRDDIACALRTGDLELPSPVSISFRLVEDWFDADSPVPLRSLLPT